MINFVDRVRALEKTGGTLMKNHYEIKGEITEITLNRRNGDKLKTIVSTSDLEKLMKLNNTWFSHWNDGGRTYYVYGNIPGTKKKIRMHRYLLDAPDNMVVDHINHDTLDNARENLRIVTSLVNSQNKKGANKNSKSGIRGVHWDKQRKLWRAVLRVNGKQIQLGRFATKEEADKMVSEARKELMDI